MKIYAFGDIHGEFFKLKALIDRVLPDKDSTLVFLGDYIDRGKYSFEVIEYLIELSNKYNCVFLEGNHENMFMDYMSGIHEKIFIYNGGTTTIKSYYKNGFSILNNKYYLERRMPKKHVVFFRSLKKYYETEDYIFVHAGIHPGTPLENMPDDILLWDRAFHYMEHYKGKTVVFGHTPSTFPMNEEHRICIDTGACFDIYGSLTCVELPERKFTKQKSTLDDIDYETDN
jgi:serine/threonine protein phosphatase 1